jgi:hypothetical protein
MITSITQKYGSFNQVSFDNSNYAMIKNSNAIKLIEQIDNNINDYIKETYLKISSNINEEENHLIDLLNNKNLSYENKKSIVKQVITKISKLSSISDNNIYPILLNENKLTATWDNLFYNYSTQEIVLKENEEETEKEISESCIDYINIIENAEELSKTKIPKEVNKINIYGVFWKKLIQTDELNDQAYDLITKSSPWWYNDLNFAELSENKIKSLINNTCINPIAISYIALKENFNGLHIALFEKRKADYFKIIEEITFDSTDLELILKSGILNNSEKLKIIHLCTDDIISTNSNLKLICSILLSDASFILKDDILKSILLNNYVPVIDRLKLFIKNENKYDIIFIESFLSILGGFYAQINDLRSRAKLTKNHHNWQLLNILQTKKYISSITELEKDYRVNHRRK